MKMITQLSIYIIYLIIAIISTLVSYKVSIIMAFVVLAIEYIRLLAIYNRIYSVIAIVFIMNVGLISYSSYQSYNLTSLKNNQIIEKNNIMADYLKTNSLKATTFQNIKADIQDIQEITVDYWLIIGIYLFLELALLMLIIGINRQQKLFKELIMRQAMMAKIHILKNNMILDEDTYRDILVRITNKESCRLLNIQELQAVIEEFNKLSNATYSSKGINSNFKYVKTDCPKMRKIFKLWISLEQAGKLRNSSNLGLNNFLRHRFRTDYETLNNTFPWNNSIKDKIIEALKEWVSREENKTLIKEKAN
ncbi:Regulatory protein GemA [Candidatus Hepatincolaceae symbiont of Richtersius coronifer]